MAAKPLVAPAQILWDAFTIFQILTTWALPSVSLIAQLPWESLNVRKRKNLEAFLNWIGAPAASMTTTVFNMIKKCNELSRSGVGMVDTLYILSCVNQYQYPGNLEDDPHGSPKPPSDSEEETQSTFRRRNRALLQGIFRHLKLSRHRSYLHPDEEELQTRLADLNSTLAFHLRLNRRKGVWPLAFNILWFGVSLVISVAVAFADLGDNTTAHSLALGLLLCWIPSLVVMAIVDRNPTNSDRCQELIERWLFNVDQVVEAQRRKEQTRLAHQAPAQQLPAQQPQDGQAHNGGAQSQAEPEQHGEPQQEEENHDIELWSRALEKRIPEQRQAFDIGRFVGQGRYLRYCGVANAALVQLEHAGRNLERLDLDNPAAFERHLTRRPSSWWITAICSQLIVGGKFSPYLPLSIYPESY